MVPAVPAEVSKTEYDYGTCVLSQVPQAEFNLVCGTSGTVQSGKSNQYHESLLKWSSSQFSFRMAARKQETSNFCQCFLLRY